ncbi:hypothetical protein BU17DRAFT_93855 [Hysterangium stoloniferum]|nr:hypothetical protein BU17DRAFT_93855 [Hysterangium stoloniferum]
MLNFSNTKHTLLPSLIPSSQMMMKTAFPNIYGQAENQIQTSSPNQALAAIPRLAFNTSNNMPFNTLSHRVLTCRPSLDPVNLETMRHRRASVSLNPPEVVRGFMFGAKGWRSEGTLGSGGEDFMCTAAAGARGPRSNGISLTGSAPVLRSGASMSTAYPHSVSSTVGAGAKQGLYL